MCPTTMNKAFRVSSTQLRCTPDGRLWPRRTLIEEARLVGGYHIFDVDEGVSAARLFKGLQRLLHKIADVVSGKLDGVAEVC